jgi:rhodanese-related sulfurtransferase
MYDPMKRFIAMCMTLFGVIFSTLSSAAEVMITPTLSSVEVVHEHKRITINRNQDRKNRIPQYYSYTSRKCPPFCIQPISVSEDVETVGELEVLAYLQKTTDHDDSTLVIDARTPQWPRKGMIPGAVNIPWTQFDAAHSDNKVVAKLMQERLGVSYNGKQPDFSKAKTLVIYCNGMWCAQSTRCIRALLALGYPSDKLKWYRGGMQAWEILGLTTVKAEK